MQTLMLKWGALTVALFCTLTLHAADNNPFFFKKNNPKPQPATNIHIPVVLPQSAVIVVPFYTPSSQQNIPVILADGDYRMLHFGGLPEEYELWDESIINPYGVRLVEMQDTIKIDMRGYFPPVQKYVTSNFGFRRGQFHYGVDLKVHKGDTVFCAFDGQVRLVNYQRRGYGNYVVVRHNNGLETLYAHFDKTLVAIGQMVKAGEALGMGGNTGRSTGYHLHFETRYLGNVINPNDLYDFEEYRVKDDIFWLSAANFEYVKEVEKIRFWTVRQGDSLSKIASRTGVSVARLCALNNIRQTTTLRIGQRIRYT
ncbi:MAG: M23 family metallopeptidase [Bacteroidales bacterium]|nr:M23 family metallopeptidase [Bacteroidales bacterium]